MFTWNSILAQKLRNNKIILLDLYLIIRYYYKTVHKHGGHLYANTTIKISQVQGSHESHDLCYRLPTARLPVQTVSQ